MTEYMCAYGDCRETATPIIVTVNNTDPKTRVRFCSHAHLSQWAQREARKDEARKRGEVYVE
jgi:hypothetical protein